jgi:hypothetical protein
MVFTWSIFRSTYSWAQSFFLSTDKFFILVGRTFVLEAVVAFDYFLTVGLVHTYLIYFIDDRLAVDFFSFIIGIFLTL